MIERHVAEQLPFMATENLLMAAVQAGGDRQDLHERIRVHSIAASEQLKQGAARERPARPDSQRRGVSSPRFRPYSRPQPLHRPLGRPGRRVRRERDRADSPALSRSTDAAISTMRQCESEARSSHSGPARRLELNRSGACRL